MFKAISFQQILIACFEIQNLEFSRSFNIISQKCCCTRYRSFADSLKLDLTTIIHSKSNKNSCSVFYKTHNKGKQQQLRLPLANEYQLALSNTPNVFFFLLFSFLFSLNVLVWRVLDKLQTVFTNFSILRKSS